jgi:hypothetical protein
MNMDRLLADVQSVFRAHGLADNEWEARLRPAFDGHQLDAADNRGRGGLVRFHVCAAPPHEFEGFHWPASLRFSGEHTALARAVLAAIEPHMPEDRYQ